MSQSTIRFCVFMFMAFETGVFASFCIPAAVCSAVVAFGYGCDCIASAIEGRR